LSGAQFVSAANPKDEA